MRSVFSKSLSLFGIVCALGACGKFTVQQDELQRPPTTSDPYAAERQRQFKAALKDQPEDAIFGSDQEEQAFEQDMLDQPRILTDEQLGEKIYENQIKRREQDRNSLLEEDEANPYENKEEPPIPMGPSEEVLPNERTATEPTATEPADEPAESIIEAPRVAPPETPKAEAPPVAPDAIPKSVSPPTPKTQPKAAPTAVPTAVPTARPTAEPVKKTEVPPASTPRSTPKPTPTPVATPEAAKPRRVRVLPNLAKNFCQTVNVTSAIPENLDYLYSDRTQLPAKLPSSQLEAMSARQKKNMFICLLMPHAIRMNAQVYAQRLEILRLQAKSQRAGLSQEDQQWLSRLRTDYRVKADSSFTELLKRVDIVPLPMLLAQAALESDWGTSRATRETNNIFGMHSYDRKNCAPGYDTGGRACMRIFRTVTEGVATYIRLLNAGTHYPKFRELRAQMRKNGQRLNSARLLDGLEKYSERGSRYMEIVKSIMSGSNNLTKYELDEEKMAANATARGRRESE